MFPHYIAAYQLSSSYQRMIDFEKYTNTGHNQQIIQCTLKTKKNQLLLQQIDIKMW